jgi:transcriptional regulator with XRE-family HTH domain
VAPIDVLIAERIRAHRRVQNISQTALAGKLGVTFQQVQKYEKGVNRVGAGRLYQLAKIFGVPVQALFPENSDARMEPGCNDAQLISKFALSADGWRLCHAFLSITDPKKRKSIVALVQQMANSQSPED